MQTKIRLYSCICRAEFRAFYKHRKILFLIGFILLVKIGCVCYSLLETNRLAEQYHYPGVDEFATEIWTNSLYYYSHFCRILPVLFYFFALYCIMTMRKTGWNEAAETACSRSGKALRYGFMLLAISGCVLVSSLLVYAIFLGTALPDWQLRTYFLGDLTRLIVLYDLLPTMFWMLAGALTGFAENRNIAAAVSAVVFYVFNSGFIVFLQQMSEVTDFFYRIGNLLCFYVPMLPDDFYYLFPMGSGCFARALFWIFLMVALLPVAGRKRLLRFALFMAAALSCLVYYLLPDGEPVYTDLVSTYAAEGNDQYYSHWDGIEAAADFGVESYDMDLKAGRQLEAEVTVRLTEGSGERAIYRFTLYHGFALSAITDQDGQKMDYDRDGDFITVYGGEGVEKIRFAYTGSGRRFYVTEYALYLPSFFPYYPVPGHYMIDDKEMEITYRPLETEAYYTVRVEADVPVECSLPSAVSSGEGDPAVRVFEGYCCGPALVGSRYVQTYMSPEGTKVIYSGMEYTEQEVAAACGKRGLSVQEFGTAIIASSPLAMPTPMLMYSDGYYSLVGMLYFDHFDRMMEWWEEHHDKIRRTNVFL